MSPTISLLLGHSFVSRINNYMWDQNKLNFQLSLSTHKVICSGKGGLLAADLYSQFQLFLSSSRKTPHLVVLDVGTNDLDLGTPPTEVARQVYYFATKLVREFDVDKVVILEVLDRSSSGRHAPRSSAFSTNVKSYNEVIKTSINRANHPSKVFFWHHKRMATYPEQYIADGVHLNPKGLSKYFYSVKRAIVKFSA